MGGIWDSKGGLSPPNIFGKGDFVSASWLRYKSNSFNSKLVIYKLIALILIYYDVDYMTCSPPLSFVIWLVHSTINTSKINVEKLSAEMTASCHFSFGVLHVASASKQVILPTGWPSHIWAWPGQAPGSRVTSINYVDVLPDT